MIKCFECGHEENNKFYNGKTMRCANKECNSVELFFYPSGKRVSSEFDIVSQVQWGNPVDELTSQDRISICDDCGGETSLGVLNEDNLCFLCAEKKKRTDDSIDFCHNCHRAIESGNAICPNPDCGTLIKPETESPDTDFGLPEVSTNIPIPECKPPKEDVHKPASKYMKRIYPIVETVVGLENPETGEHECEFIYFVDTYRILDAVKTGSASLDHAAKKLLNAGQRGVKGEIQDLKEAIWSIQQHINLLEEKGAN